MWRIMPSLSASGVPYGLFRFRLRLPRTPDQSEGGKRFLANGSAKHFPSEIKSEPVVIHEPKRIESGLGCCGMQPRDNYEPPARADLGDGRSAVWVFRDHSSRDIRSNRASIPKQLAP